MAPKGTKTDLAQKSKRKGATKNMELPPVPASCYRSVNFSNVTAEGYNALLPWLALGFAPMRTSGKEDLCGLRALAEGFNHAREAIKPEGAEEIQPIEMPRFQRWLASANYSRKVDDMLGEPHNEELGSAVRDEMRVDLLQTRNLSSEQLRLLLRVANEKMGTNFILGFITQGWRCRLDKKTNSWDTNHVKNSSIQIDSGDGGPACPVIWLWNDDVTSNDQAWHTEFEGGLNHWEGFGRSSDGERRKRVRDWQLDFQMAKDISAGVWMVTNDCLKADDNRLLDVRAGHFVRAADAPFSVRDGFRYLRACNEKDMGEVPETSLRKIELKDSALVRESANDQSNRPSGPNAENQDICADAGSRPGPKKDFGTNSSEIKRLQFFRVIEPTNKIGAPIDTEDFILDGFQLNNGEFLLDTGKRVDGTAMVTKIDGLTGRAHFRRLQLLLENPWGLPSDVSIRPDIEVHFFSTREELEAAATRRGIPNWPPKVADHDLLKIIQNWESDRKTVIPLAQLTRAYSADDAGGEMAFVENETVILVLDSRAMNEDKKLEFMVGDYEGFGGIILADHLRLIGQPTVYEPAPFGLRNIDVELLTEQWGGQNPNELSPARSHAGSTKRKSPTSPQSSQANAKKAKTQTSNTTQHPGADDDGDVDGDVDSGIPTMNLRSKSLK